MLSYFNKRVCVCVCARAQCVRPTSSPFTDSAQRYFEDHLLMHVG